MGAAGVLSFIPCCSPHCFLNRLARFEAADWLDSKISAYPDFTGWKGINRQAPNFIFIDLDLGRLGPKELNKALEETLKNIKDKLGGNPTVIWSGNGYHIYLPVKGLLLESESIFIELSNEPSRKFIQFAEQFLSDNKSDSERWKELHAKNTRVNQFKEWSRG